MRNHFDNPRRCFAKKFRVGGVRNCAMIRRIVELITEVEPWRVFCKKRKREIVPRIFNNRNCLFFSRLFLDRRLIFSIAFRDYLTVYFHTASSNSRSSCIETFVYSISRIFISFLSEFPFYPVISSHRNLDDSKTHVARQIFQRHFFNEIFQRNDVFLNRFL